MVSRHNYPNNSRVAAPRGEGREGDSYCPSPHPLIYAHHHEEVINTITTHILFKYVLHYCSESAVPQWCIKTNGMRIMNAQAFANLRGV